MTTEKRPIDVFTAGCPLCEDAVRLVTSLACPSCEVRAYDLREGCATNECREKATRYGVTAVPAVAVNGMVPDCCRRESMTADRLIAAGIGQS
jgi:hypothetical protein